MVRKVRLRENLGLYRPNGRCEHRAEGELGDKSIHDGKVLNGKNDLCEVERPLLFFDGPCQLCQRSVRWVNRHAPDVVCIPLQSKKALEFLGPDLVQPPLKGVVVVDKHGVAHVGHHGLRALSVHVKGPMRLVLNGVPRPVYKLVARTRFLWGRDEACDVG